MRRVATVKEQMSVRRQFKDRLRRYQTEPRKVREGVLEDFCLSEASFSNWKVRGRVCGKSVTGGRNHRSLGFRRRLRTKWREEDLSYFQTSLYGPGPCPGQYQATQILRPYSNPGRKDSGVQLFWLQQQEGSMVPGEVRPPTLVQHLHVWDVWK